MAGRRQSQWAYAAIAGAMGVTIVVAGVFFVLDSTGHRPFPSWLFWVEVVLLALFAAFWVFQTAENWSEGLRGRTSDPAGPIERHPQAAGTTDAE